MGDNFDEETKEFFRRFEAEVLPKLRDSAVSLTTVPDRRKINAKLCLEVGAAVLLDKPLIVVVERGTPIPANIKRVATSIVEVDGMASPGSGDKVAEAIKTTMNNDRRAKRSSH